INSMPDHIHILIGYNPQMALADLVRDIKAASSKFVNDSNWLKSKFSWQQGYWCLFVFEITIRQGN
ncbi:MAG TPA: transposase, partial [Candidatus Kapabacteria bacterium]|nr:transposase [Candidatus Kapabacteria bacterium]